MRNCAFVSRHVPTQAQLELATKCGLVLIPYGDVNAFDGLEVEELRARLTRDTIGDVVVVHPWLALLLAPDYDVWIYENGNRAPEGEKPSFEAKALHVMTGIHRHADFSARILGELTAWQRGELY